MLNKINVESVSQIGYYFVNPASNSKGFNKKMESPSGSGVIDYGICRAWRIAHFGKYSEGKGG